MVSLYNVLLRRNQVGFVEAAIKSFRFSSANLADIQQITATNLVAQALSSGDVNSVRDLLRQKNLNGPIRNAFRSMQIIQRNDRGSEAEKDNIIPKFMGLRLWSGANAVLEQK